MKKKVNQLNYSSGVCKELEAVHNRDKIKNQQYLWLHRETWKRRAICTAKIWRSYYDQKFGEFQPFPTWHSSPGTVSSADSLCHPVPKETFCRCIFRRHHLKYTSSKSKNVPLKKELNQVPTDSRFSDKFPFAVFSLFHLSEDIPHQCQYHLSDFH